MKDRSTKEAFINLQAIVYEEKGYVHFIEL
jgi:hypothetical protein